MIYKRKNIVKFFILLSLLVIFFAGFSQSFTLKKGMAFAEEITSVEVDSIQSTYCNGLGLDGMASYAYDVDYIEYFNSGSNYARDIEITFLIQGAPYYKIEYSIDGVKQTSGMEAMMVVPSDKKVSFQVAETGMYSVTCFALDTQGEELASITQVVRSDMTKPSLPSVRLMDTWLSAGTSFDVDIDWNSAKDSHSGLAYISYRVEYLDIVGEPIEKVITEVGNLEKTTLVIKQNCKLYLTVCDKAGNTVDSTYLYTMFDSTAPSNPTYKVTPSVDQNGYSNQYTVSVTYPLDEESGLKTVQNYILNGEQMEYDGEIVLTEKKTYAFTLYSENNVGLRSSLVSFTINNTSFDVLSPYIDRLNSQYDLMNEKGICTIDFVGGDYNESGIKKAYINDTAYVFSRQSKELYDVFNLSFDCFDIYSLAVSVEDNVGNVNTMYFQLDYFDNEKTRKQIKEIVVLYRTTDFSLFNEEAKARIDSYYDRMNNLLNVPNNSVSEINNLYDEIKKQFLPVSETNYSILSAPSVSSSILSYEICQEDFSDGTYGNSILVTMKKGEEDGKNYLSISGLSNGFVDFFDLGIKYNNADLSYELAGGIDIYLNVPSGYLDRKFVLVDRASMQKVEFQTENNVLCFKLKKNTSYALVISGGKAQTKIEEIDNEKSIDVFGRTWPLDTFLWLVLGTAGAAILLIGVVVIIGLKKG